MAPSFALRTNLNHSEAVAWGLERKKIFLYYADVISFGGCQARRHPIFRGLHLYFGQKFCLYFRYCNSEALLVS